MIKLNKVAMLIATITVAGSALASGSTTSSNNWRNGHGNLQWKIGNASALCWRNASWTPATAAPGCDGAIAVAAAAPAAAVAPVTAAPAPAPAAAPTPAPAPVVAAPAPAPAPAAAPAPAPKRKAKQDRN
jgi:OmpA-OmpF porin, OOP family